ncbi:unnamed protein product [Dracunculus medinensis]|uniref:EB domain-containing protein n=1 Tax=Dracunculus medinensis TaxID=318479 RepID=A0A0N4UGS4_DRAME|nr:unnamed protein product [Dracunculus medinensis]
MPTNEWLKKRFGKVSSEPIQTRVRICDCAGIWEHQCGVSTCNCTDQQKHNTANLQPSFSLIQSPPTQMISPFRSQARTHIDCQNILIVSGINIMNL